MLCYRYSRNEIDIIQDTFVWLRLNRRAIVTAMVPVAVLCVVVVFVADLGAYKFSIFGDDGLYFELFDKGRFEGFVGMLKLLLPFALYDEMHLPEVFSTYLVLTFATALILVPLIRRYFYYRKSLRGLTIEKAAVVIKDNFKSAMLCAVLLTGMCAIAMTAKIYITIVVIWPFMSVFPCAMMSQPWSIVRKGLIRMLKDILMSIFFFCVVQALPVFCLMIIYLAMFFLSTVLPGSLDSLEVFERVTITFTTLTMCISYCASLIVLMVNMVIIHGTRYYNPIIKAQ